MSSSDHCGGSRIGRGLHGFPDPEILSQNRRSLRAALVWPALLLLVLSVADLVASSSALEYFRKGDFENAAAAFERQRRDGALLPEHLLYFGDSLLQLMRLPEAESVLEDYTSHFPDDARGWHHLGLCRFAQLEFNGAVESLEHSLSIEPDQPEALKLLGRVFVAKGVPAAAERAFVRVLRQWPSDPQAHYLLGRLYQSADRLREAAGELEKTVELDPAMAKAHAYLGSVWFALGEIDRAEQQFKKALRRTGRSANRDFVPYLEYGIFLYRFDRIQESVEVLTTAVELAPNEVEARFELARALYRSHKLEEGRKQVEAALRLSPKEGRLHYLMSRICFESGQTACGKEHAALASEGRQQ